MTSKGKQFTVTREMLTAVAGIAARYSNFTLVLFCYITNHLMTGPLGKQNSLFPSGPVIKCLLLQQRLLRFLTKVFHAFAQCLKFFHFSFTFEAQPRGCILFFLNGNSQHGG